MPFLHGVRVELVELKPEGATKITPVWTSVQTS
jgi:hypothetical protein